MIVFPFKRTIYTSAAIKMKMDKYRLCKKSISQPLITNFIAAFSFLLKSFMWQKHPPTSESIIDSESVTDSLTDDWLWAIL